MLEALERNPGACAKLQRIRVDFDMIRAMPGGRPPSGTTSAERSRTAIVGTVEHWTVVRAVGSKRLVLFDSTGRAYFRLEITFDDAGKQQVQSQIVLPGTFLLKVSPLSA